TAASAWPPSPSCCWSPALETAGATQPGRWRAPPRIRSTERPKKRADGAVFQPFGEGGLFLVALLYDCRVNASGRPALQRPTGDAQRLFLVSIFGHCWRSTTWLGVSEVLPAPLL